MYSRTTKEGIVVQHQVACRDTGTAERNQRHQRSTVEGADSKGKATDRGRTRTDIEVMNEDGVIGVLLSVC